jgi:hypothetical protein
MAKKDEKEKKSEKSKLFRKGARAAGEVAASVFVRLKADEPVTLAPMVPLEEMTSIDQHEFWDTNPALIFPCLGAKDCPACKSGNKPKYKGFLPVMVRDEAEPKLLAFGITVERQFATIAEEIGDITGHVFRVKKTGTGMTTKYTVVALGKTLDVSKMTPIDPEEHITVYDADEITLKLRAIGEGSDEDGEPTEKAAKVAEDVDGDDDWGKV